MMMGRLKKMMSFALDPQLIERMEAWIGRQDVRMSKTAVIEAALREFLDAREAK